MKVDELPNFFVCAKHWRTLFISLVAHSLSLLSNVWARVSKCISAAIAIARRYHHSTQYDSDGHAASPNLVCISEYFATVRNKAEAKPNKFALDKKVKLLLQARPSDG